MKLLTRLTALTTLLLAASQGLCLAQGSFSVAEASHKEAGSERVLRETYITNQWYDNWVFGVAGGIQTVIAPEEGAAMRITPDIELNITKWITPTIGVRLGLQGLTLEETFPEMWMGSHSAIARYGEDNTLVKYKETFLHGDVLMNISNLIGGYKESRRFNVIPYAHAGLIRLGHPDYSYFDPDHRDREIAAGVGAIANIRLTDHFHLTVDARINGYSGRFHGENAKAVMGAQAAAGLTYTLHKWYWVRQTTALAPIKADYQATSTALSEARAANEELRSRNERLEAANQALEDSNRKLRGANENLDAKNQQLNEQIFRFRKLAIANPDDELFQRLAKAEAVFFYEINSDKLSETESLRLQEYIVDAYNADRSRVFYITGSADRGTGPELVNTKLSRSRAENIKKILVRSYGIPESHVVVKSSIVSNSHSDARLDRCVLFESE